MQNTTRLQIPRPGAADEFNLAWMQQFIDAVETGAVIRKELYFGDGSDGAYNSAGNETLASTTDGDPIVKQYTSFTLNAGHIMTVSNRCKGLVIFCTGDVTINGTISMDNLAARVSAGTRPWEDRAVVSYVDTISKCLVTMLVPAGGNGGTGGDQSNTGGAGGSNCAYGGSGGGGGAGRGNNGFVGGAGGSTTTGGAGGASTGANAGSPGGAGGGGIIIIIAGGNITIGATGIVKANSTGNGGNGGAGNGSGSGGGGGGAGNGGTGGAGTTSSGYGGGGGGGAGGGVVVLLRKGDYTNSGAVQVNGSGGGSGASSGGTNGTSGQAGTIITRKIAG